MDPRLRLAARIWYAATALIVLVGFALQFYLLFTGGSDANSGESGTAIPIGTRFIRLFSFFTIDSNVLVLVVSILLALKLDRASRRWQVLHFSTLLSIVVTGTVFGFILAPGLQLRDEAVIATNIFHYASPLLFTLGWLLFSPRRRWTWSLVPFVFIWPAAWLVYTFVRGAIVSWYPYPFLDVNTVGLGAALIGAGIVVVYAAVLSAIVLGVDRWLPWPRVVSDK